MDAKNEAIILEEFSAGNIGFASISQVIIYFAPIDENNGSPNISTEHLQSL